MRIFRAGAFVALAFAFLLGGCAKEIATIQNAWNVVTSASIDPKAVIVAADVFNGIEATGTVYLNQKRCVGPSKPTCRDPAVTTKIVTAIGEGRKARDAMLAFLEAHPGQLGDKGLYDALQASIATLKSIFQTYNIGGAS